MKVHLIGLVITQLLCLCLHLTLATTQPSTAICEFRGRSSYLRTFRSSNCFPLTTFPCRYKLANFRCGAGAPSTEVIVENGLNDKGEIYIATIAVNITTTKDGSSSSVINTFTRDNYDQLAQKRQFDNLWECKGSLSGGQQVIGQYDKVNKWAYVSSGGVKVNYKVREDVLTISCSAKPFKSNENFGNTFCGDPTSTYDDEDGLYREIPAQRYFAEPHAYSLWADYVALAKQTVKQTSAQCKEAARIVTKGCASRGQQLYKCHMFYTQRYDKQYRQCMNKNGINPFTAYLTCLSVLFEGGKGTSAECQTLRDVYTKCGDINGAPLKVTSLLDAADCTYTVRTKTNKGSGDKKKSKKSKKSKSKSKKRQSKKKSKKSKSSKSKSSKSKKSKSSKSKSSKSNSAPPSSYSW